MALTAVNMAYVNALVQQNNALVAQLGVVQNMADANAGYLRLGGYVHSNKGTPVINVQRNGEWL